MGEKKMAEYGAKNQNPVYVIQGYERELRIYEEYVEIDYTLRGFTKSSYKDNIEVKRIPYSHIRSITKSEASSAVAGRISFDLSRNASYDLDYSVFFSEDNKLAEDIYNYIVGKIKNNDSQDKDKSPNLIYKQEKSEDVVGDSLENYSLGQLKEAKELLDMGAISEEEFGMIKNKVLKQYMD